MMNASVNPASGSRNQALIKTQIDSTDTGYSVGKPFKRHLSSLLATSEPGNQHGIPRLHTAVSNKNNKIYSNKVIGKPLEKRTLSALNQLAAGCSAMAGSAWVRGVSLYHPANLAMSLMQQVPALVATVCPDCPGLISTAHSAADWGQAYGWANSIYTAMATGNVAAVAATAALCGASYASHHISRDTVSQLCAQLPAAVREYGEPWLQAATRVALAGALKAAGTVGTDGTEQGRGDRFIVPEHKAIHPTTEADLPSPVFDNRWDNHSEPHDAMGMAMGINATEPPQVRCSENSLPGFASNPDRPALYAPAEASLPTAALPQTKTVILPANHTGGQARLTPANADPVSHPKGQGVEGGFLQLPLAEAGLIRSFTPEQQKDHLQQAARQHQALPKQCPDLAGAVSVSDNGTVYPSESHTSGWVASPGNQVFHYQLFSAAPGSLLVTDTEGKQRPAPGFLQLAQTILNVIEENAETVKTLPPNVVDHQLPIASAHVSPPKIQNRLDPEVLASEINNSTMLVLKPCNANTGQPEASVLVLSADHEGHSVTINMGTEGFLEERSLRTRRQVFPENRIRFAPSCTTENAVSAGGILEVFVDGQWGNVCNDDFDLADARVACTQLGYPGPGVIKRRLDVIHSWRCLQAIAPHHPILLDNLNCIGNETSLLDCPHAGVGMHNCHHYSDVALACQRFELSTSDCNAETKPGSVLGRLRVYHNGTSGSVCNRGVGHGDAICQSLGFSGGVIKNTTGLCSTGTGPIHWAGLRCNGTEASPHDCLHNEQTVGCSHIDDLVLLCGPVVRLAEPQTEGSGRLEVFADGQWGTVCDNRFDSADARVACTQLGYPGFISSNLHLARTYPQANGSILLDILRCTGKETSLLDCPHAGLGVHQCVHFEDVVLACQPNVELSTGDCGAEPGFALGKLRVYHNGTWGSVCNRGVGHGDAICQSLGFSGGVIKNPAGLCSNVTGPIHWAGLSCNGTEASPLDCLHHEQTKDCTHNDDLVLLCGPTARLAQCQTERAGRLEVFANGQWGTVCNDQFDSADARVACAQLGYDGVVSKIIAVASTCPLATRSILLDNLHCNGSETSLLDCPHNGVGVHSCVHDEDVAVACQHFELSTSDCDAEVEPRFVLGKLRVYHNGIWGSVCNRGVNNGDAICQSLGFPGGGIKNTTGLCSNGTDPIHWAGLSCKGTEASPHDCLHNEQTEDCSHNDDLVLLCGPIVRLAQCQTQGAGRLEVFADGQWGTVCSNYFGSADARVACTQLGYPGAIPKIISVFGRCPQAPGSILLDHLECTGNEKSLLDCPHAGVGVHNCVHDIDVEVACQRFELSTSDCNAKVDPRFVLGRLHVYHNGTWGSVCNRGVTDGDAICQSLGFSGGVIKNTTGFCTTGTGPIHWAGLSCNGTEPSPHDCSHNEQTEGCNHNDDLVLLCGPVVRLAQCQTKGAGRLEVFVDGQWETVCDNFFDLADARVACTQLGYDGANSSIIPVAATCPQATGSILKDVLFCSGTETSLLDCPHARLGPHHCIHDEDVAVRCQIPTTPITQTPTTSKPPGASSIKRTIVGIVMGSIGVVGAALLSCAVYKKARKLKQDNEDLSTCQLIRLAVMTTMPRHSGLPRTVSTQSLVDNLSVSSVAAGDEQMERVVREEESAI